MKSWQRIPPLEGEEWLPVPDEELKGFYISNMGRACSSRGLLKGYFTRGHKVVACSRGGVSRNYSLARTVLELFERSLDVRTHVRYLDGDKSNCKLSNLKWAYPEHKSKTCKICKVRPVSTTQRRSICDRCRGRKNRGLPLPKPPKQDNGRPRKMTADEIKEAGRLLSEKKMSAQDLAQRYEVTERTIFRCKKFHETGNYYG